LKNNKELLNTKYFYDKMKTIKFEKREVNIMNYAFLFFIGLIIVYFIAIYIINYKNIKQLKEIYKKSTYIGLLKPAYKVWFSNMKSKKYIVIVTIVILIIIFIGIVFKNVEVQVEAEYINGTGAAIIGIMLLFWLYFIVPVQTLYKKHLEEEKEKEKKEEK